MNPIWVTSPISQMFVKKLLIMGVDSIMATMALYHNSNLHLPSLGHIGQFGCLPLSWQIWPKILANLSWIWWDRSRQICHGSGQILPYLQFKFSIIWADLAIDSGRFVIDLGRFAMDLVIFCHTCNLNLKASGQIWP